MHPELKAHPEYFQKEVVQLADNIYMAFGFAASNVYMIVGDDGVVIVDTTETTTAATNVLAEFRKISDLPVKTIILTHSHRDHVSGASVFAEGANPEILASDIPSGDPLIEETPHPRPVKAQQARTKRQFGIGLSYPDEIIGIGVGPGDRPLKGMGAGILPPTRRIGRAGETITTCGLELQWRWHRAKPRTTWLSGMLTRRRFSVETISIVPTRTSMPSVEPNIETSTPGQTHWIS